MDVRGAVGKPIAQGDERFDRIGKGIGPRRERGKQAAFPSPVHEIAQRAPRGAAMAVEEVFQRQLERAKSLHLANDEQIIVEEGVDDGVAGTVESRADLVRRGLAEIDVRDRSMMISKRHAPGDAVCNDAQVGETRVGLKNVIE